MFDLQKFILEEHKKHQEIYKKGMKNGTRKNRTKQK